MVGDNLHRINSNVIVNPLHLFYVSMGLPSHSSKVRRVESQSAYISPPAVPVSGKSEVELKIAELPVSSLTPDGGDFIDEVEKDRFQE